MSENYSASEMMAIIGGIGVVITAIGVAVVNVIVALRSSQKLATVIEKSDKLIGQVEQVHTLTNSNLSAVKAELSSAIKEIVSMKDVITDLKSERDKVAAASAFKSEPAKSVQEPQLAEQTGIAREQLATLENIEENTAPEPKNL